MYGGKVTQHFKHQLRVFQMSTFIKRIHICLYPPVICCILLLMWMMWCHVDICREIPTLAKAVLPLELLTFNSFFFFCKTSLVMCNQPLDSLFPPGEGAFIPEDPDVAAGMCRAQQTARSCHVSGSADEQCSGHHGSRCSPSRHAHLWAHPWC